MKAQIRRWRMEAAGWVGAWYAMAVVGAYMKSQTVMLGSMLFLVMAARTLREIGIAKTVYKNERYRELARRDLGQEFGR
jgi:hypothetical protein